MRDQRGKSKVKFSVKFEVKVKIKGADRAVRLTLKTQYR
jgi:hypothetical protein